MSSVFVIEKLEDISTGIRSTYAVCRSETVANEYLNTHDGNQLVMLASGEIVPEYIVNEYEIMYWYTDFDPIEE
jgi:hypothetical protein